MVDHSCGVGEGVKKGIGKHVKKRYSTLHDIQNDKVESVEKNVREVARFLCFVWLSKNDNVEQGCKYTKYKKYRVGGGFTTKVSKQHGYLA